MVWVDGGYFLGMVVFWCVSVFLVCNNICSASLESRLPYIGMFSHVSAFSWRI